MSCSGLTCVIVPTVPVDICDAVMARVRPKSDSLATISGKRTELLPSVLTVLPTVVEGWADVAPEMEREGRKECCFLGGAVKVSVANEGGGERLTRTFSSLRSP